MTERESEYKLLGGAAPPQRSARPLRSDVDRLPNRPCPHCGYDLRGRIGERCPECGRKVSETEIDSAIERRVTDWSELWSFRYIAYGVLPMLGWAVVTFGIGLIFSSWWVVPMILVGLLVNVLAMIWAAKEVAEESPGGGWLLVIFVAVPVFCLNLSIIGFVAGRF